MSQYSDGTVELICATNQIVGTGTLFVANVKPGAFITVPGITQAYQIVEVTDDTHLEIAETIAGPSGNSVEGLTYYIVTDFTAMLGMPMPGKNHLNVQALLNRSWKILDREIPS